jgi:4-amino-4-deoxy-L-arabinose transferase-like glycosyltransferase
MHNHSLTRFHLLLVFIASTIPRIIGAIWLPNAFGDAYAYTEQTYYLRRTLLNGSFSISSLFGFWLPLYQLICAIISAVVGNSFYVPKLVSAICGGGICVLVCAITWELTRSKWSTWAATTVVAVNPYHIFYSSSAMTDVPHAFFILLCAYCCIKRRWWLASIFALSAGLMRIESWILIPIIPVAHFMSSPANNLKPWWRLLKSIALFVCLTIGPIFWLFVSWKATGSLGKYFEIRNQYILETLAGNPWLASFSISRVAFDLLRLNYIVNPLVICGAVTLLLHLNRAVSVSMKRLSWFCNLLGTTQGLVLTFFCSHLAFLLIAYATKNQPEIWPRYGLIFFALGLPLLAQYSSSKDFKERAVNRRKALTIYAAALLFAIQFCVQLIDVTRMTVKSDPNVIAAEFLEDQHKADKTVKIYCDDGAIRVLSGIPLEEFRNQYNSPVDEKAFIQSLRDNQVRYLVYKDLPGSPLQKFIRELRSGGVRNGITIEEVVPTPRKPMKDNVVVYRVHESEMANAQNRATKVPRSASSHPRRTEAP